MFYINERQNFNFNQTGLPCIIWIGLTTPSHGPMIKVSNSYNKMLKDDNFTITIPGKKIVGNNKLSNRDLEKIFTFIDLNKELLIDYNLKRIDIHKLYNNLIKYDDIKL